MVIRSKKRDDYTPQYSYGIGISESHIEGAGHGIIAERSIPANTVVLVETYNRKLTPIRTRILVGGTIFEPSHTEPTYYTYDFYDNPIYFPVLGMFNHDNIDTNCCFVIGPGVYHRFIGFPSIESRLKVQPIIITTRDIAEGEELTLNYSPRTTSHERIDQILTARGIPYKYIQNDPAKQGQVKSSLHELSEQGVGKVPFAPAIENFQTWSRRIQTLCTEIYPSSPLVNDESLSLYVSAVLGWRLMLLMYRENLGPKLEIFLDKVIVDPEKLKIFLSNLRKKLNAIVIHGPDNIFQHPFHKKRSLWNILNRFIPPVEGFERTDTQYLISRPNTQYLISRPRGQSSVHKLLFDINREGVQQFLPQSSRSRSGQYV